MRILLLASALLASGCELTYVMSSSGSSVGSNGNGGGSYGGYYTTQNCSSYGQICEGESPTNGAFEAVILPYASDVYGVTVTVTFVDAAHGDDLVVTTDLYPNAYGEYWFYSPAAPPSGYVEVEALVYLQPDYAVDGMCDRDPQADMIAYNNLYEVDVDYRYTSDICYAKADLDRVVSE